MNRTDKTDQFSEPSVDEFFHSQWTVFDPKQEVEGRRRRVSHPNSQEKRENSW
jgi:hypothetical protein